MKIEAKVWPLDSEQGLKEILPSDLVFDLTLPLFEIDRDMSIILVKFHEDWSKTVASREWTKF